MGGLRSLAVTVFAGGLLATAAHALDQRSTTLNQNVVGLLAAEIQWMPEALEIADALQHEEALRVVPMAGIGAVQAVADLAFLQSVDAAILPVDVVSYARLQGLASGLDGKLTYVARIADIEFVLVVRRSIKNITGLAGKRIATGPAQSAGFASGELLLGALEVPFLRVPRQGAGALLVLKRGQADAALVTTADLEDAALDRALFHVLPLPIPAGLADTYAPAILTVDEVPSLLTAKQTVETVSTSLALAVFNWPRRSEHYGKLRRFSSALFAASNDISGGGKPTNLSAMIPGWQRHDAAIEALAHSKNPTNEKPLQQGDGQ